MVDRERVIKGLEHCGQPTECDGCPYDSEMGGCFRNLKADALNLLKEQEPRKKGYWKYPQNLDCCCSECGNQPDREPGESVPLYNYCPYCGAEMAVKWDD